MSDRWEKDEENEDKGFDLEHIQDDSDRAFGTGYEQHSKKDQNIEKRNDN
jgi:hypothetical protein